MQDLISRQAAIDALRGLSREDGFIHDQPHENLTDIIRALPSAQSDNQVNLCDSCKYSYPDCPSEVDDVIFGNGKGNDNICACNKYEPSAQSENDWIPVTKKAHPDIPIRVQVQMDNGWIITAYYQEGEWLSVPDCGEPLQDNYIKAWRELPEPYTEVGKNEP